MTVDQLINPVTRAWDTQVIRSLVDSEDVHLIESIPLGRKATDDKDGWHFTENGKYSVKSGYQIARVYPDTDSASRVLGPTTDALKAFCWKVKCPPKMKHFLWQIISGCVAVKQNLLARGMKGDTVCARCGNQDETINHVFFECPPARQIWALSKIHFNPDIFPTAAIFTNMDSLFWRRQINREEMQYPWILWYILKARNNKVFSNIDTDPRDTLRIAETEYTIWNEAQIKDTIMRPGLSVLGTPPLIEGRWCFTDGSWKEKELFLGQGWYSTLEGFDALMGARNVRASLSPLHSEIEALIWAMECMRNLRQYRVIFATDCAQVVKMISEPEEWPAFATYLDDLKSLRESFTSSEIYHVPRTQNMKADKLAKHARVQPHFVVHMDSELPVWITESI